jgi:hypothetical protein
MSPNQNVSCEPTPLKNRYATHPDCLIARELAGKIPQRQAKTQFLHRLALHLRLRGFAPLPFCALLR